MPLGDEAGYFPTTPPLVSYTLIETTCDVLTTL
jgi:hypothetical protein